jgi:hypothetical protein
MKQWQYKQACELKVNDIISVLSDNNLPVDASIESIIFKNGEKFFYRLNVEPTDNYFANTLCIHNSEEEKSSPPPPSSNPDKDKKWKDALKALADCGGNPNDFDSNGCPKDKAKGEEAHKKACEQSKKAKDHMKGSKDPRTGQQRKGSLAALVAFIVGEAAKAGKACGPFAANAAAKQLLAYEDNFCGGGNPWPKCCDDPPPGCCIEENTLIHTPTGVVPVKYLKNKDEVLSFDIEGAIDSTKSYMWSLWYAEELKGNVKTSFVKSNKWSIWHTWYEVLLSNGSKLNITYEHPVLVKTEGLPGIIG